jgi:hypothetical protein
MSISGDGATDIDRPELSADPALAKPSHVGHQRLGASAVGAAREVRDAILVILAELFGQVVMAVDQRGLLEDAIDAGLRLRVEGLRVERRGRHHQGRD